MSLITVSEMILRDFVRILKMSRNLDERLDPETDIDASGKNMWSSVSYNFLRENFTKSIIFLDFTSNHVSLESANYLAEMLQSPNGSLQYLNLTKSRMHSRSAIVIFAAVGQSKLLEFVADDNIFTDEPCKKLGQSLARDPPLYLLSLCGCEVTAEGCVSIAKGIETNNHLRHLRLDSNSIYDYGANAIANVLNKLESLSVSDNYIWADGTNRIIKSAARSRSLISLDLSMNIVSLEELRVYISQINQPSNLRQLAITGCKVEPQFIRQFIESLVYSRISTLIIEGVVFGTMPVSWPTFQDTLWSDNVLFTALRATITESQSLTDLRIGFLDLDQFDQIQVMNKSITICVNDFGRTNDCWVAHYPNLRIMAPCSTFEWKAPISIDTSRYFSRIFKVSYFNNMPLQIINVSGRKLNNDLIERMFSGLDNTHLKELDLSKNELTDMSLNAITRFLTTSTVEIFKIDGNQFTDYGCASQLISFYINNNMKSPRVLHFSYRGNKGTELSTHETFIQLAALLSSNPRIQELHITGPISSSDASSIITVLATNSNLEVIELISDYIKNYENPDPPLLSEVESTFIQMIQVFDDTLHDRSSQCALREFVFPYFTEVYLYHPEILKHWKRITYLMDSRNNLP